MCNVIMFGYYFGKCSIKYFKLVKIVLRLIFWVVFDESFMT